MTIEESSGPLPDGRRERWRAHRELRRAELIEAVIAAVDERGPNVGMDDISAVSGVAKPVFYRYFADKSDLFLAVGRSVAEELVKTVMVAIDSRAEPREKLEAGIEAYVAAVEAKPDLYRFVALHQAPARTGGADLLGDYASVVGAHASRVIGGFLRSAGLDSGAADPWGFGIVGMARAATDRWLEQQTMSRADLVTYLTDLVWPGLTAQARRAVAPAQR